VWLTIVVYALSQLYQGYNQQTDSRIRNQLKYAFSAFVIGFVGGSSSYLWVFDFNLYPYTPFGTYGVPIYSAIMTYAIVKHHLMDINVVIRKGVIYSTLIGLITALYFGTVYLVSASFGATFLTLSSKQSITVTLIAMVLIALLFKPLERRIQKFLDRTFFKDTAEAIQRENERLRAEMVRAEQAKAVSILASGMAHEIKNPLTAIRTFTEHLETRHQDPAFRTKFQRIVLAELEKISHTVQQVLSFAKPQATHPTTVQLPQLLDDTLDLLSNDLLSHRVHVTRHYNGINTIQGDPVQLKQVFLNLFLNSLDAMPNGGQLSVATAGANGTLTVTVADTGCGMPQDYLNHLFEPFYTTKQAGTGLGLYVVQRIIHDHAGTIRVTSQHGQGTTIAVQFSSDQNAASLAPSHGNA